MLKFLLVAALLAQDPTDQRAMRIAKLSKISRGDSLWTMRCLALIGLSDIRHPDAVVTVLERMHAAKDKRVRRYAAVSLERFDPGALRAALTSERLDRLIKKDLRNRNEFYRSKILATLQKSFTTSDARTPEAWSDWWKKQSESYQAEPFKDPGQKRRPPTHVATEVRINKLIDLRKDGLDLALLLDETGSMRAEIDAAKKGIEEIASMIREIVPKLRIALVTYDDESHVQLGFTTNYKSLAKKLEKIKAEGGGDFEEGVDKAIATALQDKKLSWRARAAKVVIVIGDAPMHEEDTKECLELIRRAHEEPETLLGRRRVSTGGEGSAESRSTVRPWTFSVIRTGGKPQTVRNFGQIVRAGGGTVVVLSNAAQVTHKVFLVTFGSEWKEELEVFLEAYSKVGRSK